MAERHSYENRTDQDEQDVTKREGQDPEPIPELDNGTRDTGAEPQEPEPSEAGAGPGEPEPSR